MRSSVFLILLLPAVAVGGDIDPVVAAAWGWTPTTAKPAAITPNPDAARPVPVGFEEYEWRPDPRAADGWGLFHKSVSQTGVVSGVTTLRPFAAGGTTGSTRATGAPTPLADTSRPTSTVGPKTTAPTGSKAETPTAVTTTDAPGAAPLGGIKFLVSERTDSQGNTWKYYSDGSVVVCSAFG